LSGFVHRQTDGLLGMDILSRRDVLMDVPAATITFRRDPLSLSGEVLNTDDLLGVPIVTARIEGREVRLFFDTGAKLGYLVSADSFGGSPAGDVEDFYPTLGAFTAPAWNIEMRLGRVVHATRCGQLPQLLALTLQLAVVQGIVGNDLIARRRALLSTNRRMLVLE
jgi:hypothetical protein